MLRHLLTLLWKRKTRNLMLSLEILLAFVIVFAIAATGVRYAQLYRMPLGFDYAERWSVNVATPEEHSAGTDAAGYDLFRRTLLAMPEVEQVAFTTFGPFRSATMRTQFERGDDGRKLSTNVLVISDDYPALMNMHLAEGRWFSKADDGATAIPVVLNRRAALTLFPDGGAVGKHFLDNAKEPGTRREYQVTGIVDELRDKGEFMGPVNFTLVRHLPDEQSNGFKTILLKLKPGVPRTFEAALSRQLKALHSDWGYEISPLADMRHTMLRSDLIPLAIGAVIAGFLLLMVAFGLFGVLWQNTTQRIPEIGLRRAVGASGAQIYRQIIGEQLLLSSAAMGVALLLLVQLPLTGTFGEHMNWAVFGLAAALSMALIYLLSLLCALYPGWRASRLSPTQALHYE